METITSHTSRSPDTIERAPLRRAAHSLAELSKTGTYSIQLVYRSALGQRPRRKTSSLEPSIFVKFRFSRAEENVDLVVVGGGISAVVPLLAYFKSKDGEPQAG